MRRSLARTSKFLSLVLRHDPGRIGLRLDEAGWATVDELLRGASEVGHPISREVLEEVVATNDKQRFSFSADGLRIRANQGHTVEIDLGLEAREPPEVLFHGTAQRNVGSIRDKGLAARGRHHVHLSLDPETAKQVGARHGHPVVLTVEAGRMHADGYEFFLSENKVWLTVSVPRRYITFPDP